MTEMRIGTSGWLYPPWRGVFYPKGLPHRRELEYLSRRMNSVEINGSFYSQQRPDRYRRWRDETPDGFLFSVKGPRFITHMKQLRDVETPMANFFASGVLALGHKLGPLLWQLPPRMSYDSERIDSFLAGLPRSTGEAAELAKRHDDRLKGEALTEAETEIPLRHALEVRHPSFAVEDCVQLLRRHQVALVVADTAGTWPYLEDMTADFGYIRLHGDEELYVSGYTDQALDAWAAKIELWTAGESPRTEHTVAPPPAESTTTPRPRDIYVYFDNDTKVMAPRDAMSLAARLGARPPVTRDTDGSADTGTDPAPTARRR
jgi:uncharacterized protein YecE (DUF72 family)